MDTEAFLLARREILQRLETRRIGSLLERQERRSGLFGIPWSGWAGLLSGGIRSRFATRWFIQLILPSLLPAVMAFAREKSPGFSSGKGLWTKLTGFLSSFTSRRPW